MQQLRCKNLNLKIWQIYKSTGDAKTASVFTCLFIISPQMVPPANMGRKYSAPGQLCPSSASNLSGHPPIPNTPATSLGTRKGSLCPTPQYGYPSAPYSAQWVSSAPHAQSGLHAASQPLGQFPPVPNPIQTFHMSTLQKSVSHPGGPNLKST